MLIIHVLLEQARNEGYLEALKALSLSFEENCDQIARNKYFRNQPEYLVPDFMSFDYADILIGEKMEKKQREKYGPVIVLSDGHWRPMVDVNEKIKQHTKFREGFLEQVKEKSKEHKEKDNLKEHKEEEKGEGITMGTYEKALLNAHVIKTIQFEMGLRKWLRDRLAFAAASRVSKLEKWKQIIYLTGEKGFGKWSYFLNGCSWDFSRAIDRPTDMLERLSAIRDITRFVILQQLNAKALFIHALSRDEAKKLKEDEAAADREKPVQQNDDKGERMKERKL
ncbi:hypothetical protein EYC80_005414 [Monilinia laxa]|uniref:Uncharacterized protein n=1 Tax=Monilinia laxa TaxID=61186 RepID=A0A5N6KK45_MONLA|nr:hypothetical protein EYC80_005414 [Monilinia laxa]